jgi:prevent-host-death family protein
MLISASDFKAKCLAILDRVGATGEEVTITKRGVPVATLTAFRPSGHRYPQDGLKGSVVVVGDILGPAVPIEYWEALSGLPKSRRTHSRKRRGRR